MFIGVECQSDDRRGMLNLNYPIGINGITDWEDIENIWTEVFYVKMGVKPENNKFYMTEPPLTKKENREKMAEIMFEKLNVPEMYVGVSAVCALFAFGKTTGIVLESGHTVTHTVPIYEGFALPHAILKMDMGGRDLTAHLKAKIIEN